jgi:hypothetical protein
MILPRSLQFLYSYFLRGEKNSPFKKISVLHLRARGNFPSSVIQKYTKKNCQLSYLLYFETKLCSFAKLRMLFLAVMIEFLISNCFEYLRGV